MFGSYGRTAENGHVMPLAGPYLPVNKSYVLYVLYTRLGLVKCISLCRCHILILNALTIHYSLFTPPIPCTIHLYKSSHYGPYLNPTRFLAPEAGLVPDVPDWRRLIRRIHGPERRIQFLGPGSPVLGSGFADCRSKGMWDSSPRAILSSSFNSYFRLTHHLLFPYPIRFLSLRFAHTLAVIRLVSLTRDAPRSFTSSFSI